MCLNFNSLLISTTLKLCFSALAEWSSEFPPLPGDLTPNPITVTDATVTSPFKILFCLFYLLALLHWLQSLVEIDRAGRMAVLAPPVTLGRELALLMHLAQTSPIPWVL